MVWWLADDVWSGAKFVIFSVANCPCREDEWGFREIRTPVLRIIGESVKEVHRSWCLGWRWFWYSNILNWSNRYLLCPANIAMLCPHLCCFISACLVSLCFQMDNCLKSMLLAVRIQSSYVMAQLEFVIFCLCICCNFFWELMWRLLIIVQSSLYTIVSSY